MWVRPVGAFLILVSSLSQQSTATGSDSGLKPMGAWVLDYAETHCLASRQYGTAKDPIYFGIRPAPNGQTYELLVGRARYGPEFAEEFEGRVIFSSEPIRAWLLHYGGGGKKVSIDQFRISAADMAQARTAKSVRLHAKFSSDVNFALYDMDALLKGLADCTEDLKRYWNIAPAERAKIGTPPKGDIRSIFTAEDYPSEAIYRGQQGTVQFLLLIDATGKISACHVLRASGVPVLDGMGCQVIVKRAKFKPALDQQGKPVRSSYVTPPVTWRIGG